MSLLTNPPHVVSVIPLQPRVADGRPVRDENGDQFIDELPVVDWPCSVQPTTEQLQTVNGLEFVTVVRLSGLGWPGGSMARVEYGGESYDQIGEPAKPRMSLSTSHDVVMFRKAGAAWQRSI